MQKQPQDDTGLIGIVILFAIILCLLYVVFLTGNVQASDDGVVQLLNANECQEEMLSELETFVDDIVAENYETAIVQGQVLHTVANNCFMSVAEVIPKDEEDVCMQNSILRASGTVVSFVSYFLINPTIGPAQEEPGEYIFDTSWMEIQSIAGCML